MTSWFRSWHGAPTDNKWLVIAAKAKVAPGIVSAVAWALFDHASQADDRGSVADFDTETYAVFSGFGESQVQAVIAAMYAKGVIDEDGRLHAWDKRQPKREDDSAERVRRHRERKNADGNGDNGSSNGVTQCNDLQRTETHVTHTEPDTEPDTDSKVVVVVGDQRGEVVKLYENNMPGSLTPIIADQLNDLIDTYGSGEVAYAIKAACEANVRTFRYITGILTRRAAGEDKPKQKGNGKPATNGNGYGQSKVEKSLANAAALREKLARGETL